MAQSEPRLPSLAHRVLRNPNPQRPCKACEEQESRPGQQDRGGSALTQPRPQTRHGQNSLGPSFWTQPGGTAGDEEAPRRMTPPLQEGRRRSQLDGAHLATLFSSPLTHTTHTTQRNLHTHAHPGTHGVHKHAHSHTQDTGHRHRGTYAHSPGPTHRRTDTRGARGHTHVHTQARAGTPGLFTPPPCSDHLLCPANPEVPILNVSLIRKAVPETHPARKLWAPLAKPHIWVWLWVQWLHVQCVPRT